MSRICLLTDSRAPSGVGAHMMTLAGGLDADEVVVAARAGTGLLERAAAEGYAVKALGETDDRGADLARWLARAAPDILHVHAGIGWEGHAAVRAARDAGVPVIRTEHLPYLLTDAGQRDEHRDGASSLARLICVSDAVGDSYRQAGVDPALVATIHNGVGPHRPSRSRSTLRGEWGVGDAPVLLMVARFAEQKGHGLLLDALPAIRAAHPDAVVLLAGDGPLLMQTARAVAALGLADMVRMLGSRADVTNLMALADLLLLPSIFEGLPLVALEAMAAGLPVVATAAPGNGEAIEDGVTGILSAGDPASFAEAVTTALADRERLAAMGSASIERHGRLFSADRMIADTRAVYAAVRDQTEHTGDGVERTRIGFIGAGGIANRHFGVLEQFDDVAIVAVADVDMARATEAAARFGARAFDDAAAMLAAVELDALYICVPPFAHGEPERLAIEHKLPFFVEKPVALDLGTAEDVAAAVDRLGLVTAVGYHWRYLDTVDEVKALLSATPARLLSGYWLDSTPPPRWWWKKDASGGQMLEQTTHLVDLARYLVGDVVRVYGQSGHVDRAAFPGLDVATTSTAMLTFASGAIANFASTCLLNWNHRVGLHVFGEGLAIELTDRDVMIDIGRGRPVRGTGSDPVVLEDRDFIDAVRGGENKIRCPYPAALETLRLALAIERSANEGRAIDVREREVAHV